MVPSPHQNTHTPLGSAVAEPLLNEISWFFLNCCAQVLGLCWAFFRNLGASFDGHVQQKNVQQWGIAACGGNGFLRGHTSLFWKIVWVRLWSNTYPERGELLVSASILFLESRSCAFPFGLMKSAPVPQYIIWFIRSCLCLPRCFDVPSFTLIKRRRRTTHHW